MTRSKTPGKPLDDAEIARRIVLLEHIYVANDVSEAVIRKLTEYCEYAKQHISFAASLPPEKQRATKVATKVLPILGVSGVGKSVAFREFIGRSTNAEDEARGKRTVLEVALQQAATPRTMWSDVLAAYGAEDHDRGVKDNLARRAHQYRVACETKTWIFDEVNHLIDKDTAKTRWSVAEAIKSLAETSRVGIVLVGQDNVRDIIRNNTQIGTRAFPLVSYRPLDLNQGVFEDMARKFYADYAQRMLELGVVAEKPDLSGCFFKDIAAVSYGRLGTGCQYVMHAATYAWKAGARNIEQCHFDAARKTWVEAHNIMSKTSLKKATS